MWKLAIMASVCTGLNMTGQAGALVPYESAGHLRIDAKTGGFDGELDNGDRFGRSVTRIGDINGDGVIDLVVGARSDDDGQTDAGAVWILFMNEDGTVGDERKISSLSGGFPPTLLDASDFFGYGVADVGDLDGDGRHELAVSARNDDDAAVNAGAVYILFLDGEASVTAWKKMDSPPGSVLAAGDWFGESVNGIGDIDGDGLQEMVVGAPGDDGGGNDRGAIYIVSLDALGNAVDGVKISSTAGGSVPGLGDGDRFGGRDAVNVGDVDGDGQDDLIVAAFQDDDGGLDRGAAWVLLLNRDLTVAATSKISGSSGGLAGPLDDEDNFGMSLVPIGDVDGDGVPDVIATANRDDDGFRDSGAIYLLTLTAAGTVKAESKISRTSGAFALDIPASDRFGRAAGLIGDLRGDGTVAIAFGAGAAAGGGAIWILFFDFADCGADVGGDGVVDFLDVLAVLAAWGPCAACDEDLDDDGMVGFGDLLVVLGEWGVCRR